MFITFFMFSGRLRLSPNIVIVYGSIGNFNSQVMMENYMPTILDPFIVSKRIHKLNFLLDQTQCHLTGQVQAALKQRHIVLTRL